MIYLILIHWIADFVLQKHQWSIDKSKSNKALLKHTSVYSASWFVLWPLLGFNTVYFVLITFVLHTITDYFTSRLNSKLWKEGQVHNFFVSIGFDQVLHYVQLIATFNYLL